MTNHYYRRHSCLLFLVLFFMKWGYGQIEVEPATNQPFNPESLIKSVFLGKGIEILDIQFRGDPSAVGYFSNGLDDIGISEGLVMSTGKTFNIPTPNTQDAQTSFNGIFVQDAQLAENATSNLIDVVLYEIEFIPQSENLSFKYTFASEEYPEFSCNCFNDVFGFFIQRPNTNDWENLALVPGTNDPVSVLTIHPADTDGDDGGCTKGGIEADCGPVNEHLYNDNTGSPNFYFDGYSDVLTAQTKVVPCQTYRIKLALADVRDQLYDSAIFLEGSSFGSDVIEIESVTANIDRGVVEGCTDGQVFFQLSAPTLRDTTINFSIIGTAQNGIDYESVTPSVFIPSGDSIGHISILPLEDNEVENMETVGVVTEINACTFDTIWINILENQLVPPDLGADLSICAGETVQLDGNIDFLLPNENRSFNTTSFLEIPTIPDNAINTENITPAIIPIEVAGIQPTDLEAGLIESVCVQIFTQRADQIDLYLQAPSGQILELTSDNGGLGDDYFTTCFTPTSSTNIMDGNAPFDGDFLPEGDWSILWQTESKTNGTWSLFIKDDQSGIAAQFLSASINFNPTYQLSYQWEVADNISCLDCATPTVSPSTTTQYKLLVSDSYGCEVSDSIMVNLGAILEAPEITCENITSNSITLNWIDIADADGYEVNINSMGWGFPNTDSTTHQVNNLAFGDTIDIQVRGLNETACDIGIAEFRCATLPCSPPNPSLLSVSPVSCYGAADGGFELMADIADAQFVLDRDTNSTGIFNNLAAGTYQVSVRSSDFACGNFIELTITSPDSIELNVVNIASLSCFESNDGQIEVDIIGGTPPYVFDWEEHQLDSSTITNLSAGTYALQIVDAMQCTDAFSFFVPQPSPIEVVFSPTLPACNGADGSIMANVSGGSGNYSFQWDDEQNQQAALAQNLRKGIYSLIVTDGNDCRMLATFDLEEDGGLQLQANTNPVLCLGDATGTATVMATGGTPPYLYLWDDATEQETATATDLLAGDYTILVLDINGCEASMTVRVPDVSVPLEGSFEKTDISCFGKADGEIRINSSIGDREVNYAWSNGQVSDQIANLSEGLYFVTMTDDNGCQEIDSITIIEPPLLSADLEIDNISCPNNFDGQIIIIPTGGVAPFEYSLDGNRFGTTDVFTNLGMGRFTPAIRDANNCRLDLEAVEIQEPLPFFIQVEDFQVEEGDSIELLPMLQNAMGMVEFNWTGRNISDLSCSDCPNPTLIPTQTNLYNVEAIDENGCQAETVFTVIVRKTRSVYVPTGFSPNEDGVNDKLTVFGQEGTTVLSFKIFNRWGELVFDNTMFSVNNIEAGWDGTFRGQSLNPAVFTWLAEVQFLDGEIRLEQGNTTLIR